MRLMVVLCTQDQCFRAFELLNSYHCSQRRYIREAIPGKNHVLPLDLILDPYLNNPGNLD